MARHNRKRADDPREEDPHAARRARRHRRFRIRLLVLLAVTALVVTVVRNWETLAPDVLLSQISDLLSGGTGDSFPVDVSGNQIYQMESVDGNTVLLSDTYATMLSGSGAEIMRRAHAYSDPQLRTAGKYVLIVERGGKRVQLETREKTMKTLSTDYDILTSALYKNGNFAVVTGSEQGHNAAISVYSAAGALIYHRLCSNMVADVAFSPDGSRLAMITVNADAGALRSAIEVVSLHSNQSETLYSHSETDVLLCRLQYLSDSTIAAVGDTAVWMYIPKKDDCRIYPLTDGDLRTFAIGDDGVVTVTQPYGTTTGGTVTYIRSDGTATFNAAIEGVCRDVAASGDRYALLTGSYLYQIGSKGIIGSRAMETDGKLVSLSGSRAVVLGLKNLSKYTAPSRLNESD